MNANTMRDLNELELDQVGGGECTCNNRYQSGCLSPVPGWSDAWRVNCSGDLFFHGAPAGHLKN